MERDDIIEYSLNTDSQGNAIPLHGEEAGAKIRRKIWMVTILLTVITVVEVGLGAFIKQTSGAWPFVKWSFIIMTLFKAGYIVMVFMHLGDERKNLRYVVLVPYLLFMLYLIFIALYEGLAIAGVWSSYGG
jgi:cytochrome c oxidase subunit 4